MAAENVILKTCALADGLTATLCDTTRHYFGGYFHVRIRVSVPVELRQEMFADEAEFRDAQLRLGQQVEFSRVLEKMAVPREEIEAVRQQLLKSFDDNVLPYMSRDGFAAGFLRSEYRDKLKNIPRFPL